VDTYVGDVTLTVTGGYNVAGDTTYVLSAAGQWVTFTSVKVGSSYYWRLVGSWQGVDLASPYTSVLYVGDSASSSSVDPMVNVNRDVDDGTSGNGHCFSDSSQITRSGDIAYNSFDGRITVSGTADYAHFASFQSAPIYGSSGTVSIHYGMIDVPTVSGGTITNRYGFYASNPTGAGAITNNYGVYIPAQTKGGTLNLAIATAGTTASAFGGSIVVGELTEPTAGVSIEITGAYAGATHYGIQTGVSAAGNSVGFDAYNRTYSTGNVTLVMGMQVRPIHGSSGTLATLYGTYTGMTNSGGVVTNCYGHYVADTVGAGTVTNQYGMRIAPLSKGGSLNWGIYVDSNNSYFGGDVIQNPSASVTPANNGELMVEATNNTTLTFKLKGTDGTVRSGTLTLS
jgi:hypothetical protein